jgi:hypothetical protein
MSYKDNAAESTEQDCMCISCRDYVAKYREKSAFASFSEPLRGPVADWFERIIESCKFEFTRRIPDDINETATVLFYASGKLQITCHATLSRIVLSQPCPSYPTQPDWVIEFHCPTPERLVLAAIKAAADLHA